MPNKAAPIRAKMKLESVKISIVTSFVLLCGYGVLVSFGFCDECGEIVGRRAECGHEDGEDVFGEICWPTIGCVVENGVQCQWFDETAVFPVADGFVNDT